MLLFRRGFRRFTIWSLFLNAFFNFFYSSVDSIVSVWELYLVLFLCENTSRNSRLKLTITTCFIWSVRLKNYYTIGRKNRNKNNINNNIKSDKDDFR